MFAIDVVGSGGTVVIKKPARPGVDYAFEDEASFYEHRAGLLAIQKKNCEVSSPIVCFWKRSTSQFWMYFIYDHLGEHGTAPAAVC
jgi:hypothetical protein